MDGRDAARILVWERYRRDEISERATRELLGNDVVDVLNTEVEVFESAIELGSCPSMFQ